MPKRKETKEKGTTKKALPTRQLPRQPHIPVPITIGIRGRPPHLVITNK
jgi:hypothetical protein